MRLTLEEFYKYLDLYFVEHTNPKDLCPQFNLSVGNHNRRVRKAIKLELKLANGTTITNDLYKKEKLAQDSEQAYEIMKKYPDLLQRIGYIPSYEGTAGQKRGKYSAREEGIIFIMRNNGEPYSKIRDYVNAICLKERTISQLKLKYHRMVRKMKIPRLPANLS